MSFSRDLRLLLSQNNVPYSDGIEQWIINKLPSAISEKELGVLKKSIWIGLTKFAGFSDFKTGLFLSELDKKHFKIMLERGMYPDYDTPPAVLARRIRDEVSGEAK